ncbi:hypothetical protein ACMGD3_20850 [Lysinibacillus sphaericus]|uniref:hypothetical protein n=1 Tax=Lysinibacillus sphaericus TaxID=1421 RepID=UPI003F79AA66
MQKQEQETQQGAPSGTKTKVVTPCDNFRPESGTEKRQQQNVLGGKSETAATIVLGGKSETAATIWFMWGKRSGSYNCFRWRKRSGFLPYRKTDVIV